MRSQPTAMRGGRVNLVTKEPIHEQVLPHIRRDIVLNRWAPGERLPEMELCNEFGISRTPLRDALKILEVDGLIELLPHVGAVVTRMDPPDLAEKFEVLNGLEQMAAAKVARTRPPDVLTEINRLHRAMVRAAKAVKTSEYYRLNDEFHRAIVLGTANQTLARMHEVTMWHVSRARHRANEHEPVIQAAADHHSAIVKCIFEGDAEGAARAMGEHLDEVSRIVLKEMKALSK